MSTEYKLPRKYLSYSAMNLWRNDRNEFRRIYYENGERPTSPYMLFGKEVAEALERGEYPHIPRLSHSEYELKVDIDGVTVLGYADSFDPTTGKILEYKTGIPHSDGRPRWTQSEVQKLDQLPLYSLLVKEKLGLFEPWTQLLYLPTKWEAGTKRSIGETQRTLRLTGEYVPFDRKIAKWEHKRMRAWIRETAEEISEDYSAWLTQQEL